MELLLLLLPVLALVAFDLSAQVWGVDSRGWDDARPWWS